MYLYYSLVLLGLISLPSVKVSLGLTLIDIVEKVATSYTSRSTIVLLSQKGFHDMSPTTNWNSLQPLNNPSFPGLEWTWLIFSNVSKLPIRSNYYQSPPLTTSSVLTRRVNPNIKFIIWLNTENEYSTTSSQQLKYFGQVEFDIFAFLGSQSVLEKFFKSKVGLSIRFKFGVVINTSEDVSAYQEPKYLVNPPIFSNGLMQISNIPPKFCQNCIHLQGYKFKVSANTLAPFIMYRPETGDKTGGTNYMMLQYASTSYNFSLEWDIGLTRGNGKLQKNGSADGMLGDVLSGKADIAFIARLAQGQVGVIDLTECNSIDTLVFLTRIPEAKLEWAAVIHIFTGNAWGLIGLCFLSVIPVYYLSMKLQRERHIRQLHLHGFGCQFCYRGLQLHQQRYLGLEGLQNLSDLEFLYKAWNIPFALTFSQSIKHIPVQAYLISVFWMIFILNINTCYNSNLSSYLTSLTSDAVPRDFEELCQRLDYNITFNYLNNGSCDCFHFFNESRSPTIIQIRERFLHNLEPDTGQCVLNAVLKKKSTCIGWSSVTAMGIAKNATLYEGLNLVQVSKSVHISLNSIGLQRHSRHTRSFSRFISAFRDMGMITRFKEDAEAQERVRGKAWIHENKVSDIYKVLTNLELDRRTLVRPFDIENFSLSFLLLLVGLAVSIFAFVLEKICSPKKAVKIIM